MRAKTLTLSKNKAAYLLYLMRKNIPYMLMYSALFLITSLPTMFSRYFNSDLYYKLYSYPYFLYNLSSSPLLVIAPFLAAILNFRFLTNRQANDMMFSMPISKKNMFFSNYFAGAASYLVTFIIFKNPFWMFLSYQNNQTNEQTIDFLKILNASLVSFGISVLLFIACFSFAVFLCVNIGKIFDACLYYGLLSIFTPIAFSAIMIIFNSSLFGVENTGTFYSRSITVPEIISALICHLLSINYYSPGSGSAVQQSGFNFGILVPICIYSVFCIGFTLLSYYLFKKRPREKTDTPFAFDYMKTLLAVVISFFIGIVFSLIFSFGSVNLEKMLFALIPFIIVSLITYLGVTAIANRSFKVFNKKTSFYGITLVLYFVIVAYFSTGGFGAITYIPEINDIEKVTINLDANRYIDNSSNSNTLGLLNLSEVQNNDTNTQNVTFTNNKKIKDVTKFHSKILEFYQEYDYDYNKINQQFAEQNNYYYQYNNYSPRIVYTLKNGKEVIRQYNDIDSSLLLTEEYNNISNESDKYNGIYEGISRDEFSRQLNNYDFTNLTVNSNDFLPSFMIDYNSEYIDINPDDMKGLILAIFEDEKGFKNADEFTQKPYITIQITGNTDGLSYIMPDFLNLTINQNYNNTIKYLEAIGIYKKERSLNRDENIKIEVYENLPQVLNTSSTKVVSYGGKEYFISDFISESYYYLDPELEYYKVNTISIFKDYEAADKIINDLNVKHEYNTDGIIVRFKTDYGDYSRSFFIPKGCEGYNSVMKFLER